ncbi:hypothetical protein BGZ99_005293 [Dissophora globulifera]|uniref:Xrn1 N-terminal domain-containing protein n=1 Tax=Dissophora globulifera TaxID=979702 RepID=A0A9P6RJE0_9FUNG|nr:hypothetical protein BGZ99_005293 [Dissophora globulifera]
MGLKQVKFIDWFQTRFPQAARSIPNHEGSRFDSVFIDVNCILHPAMRTAKNETQFVKKLFSILDRLLAQFIPNRVCYLSVDGPAPAAKLLTQKARRATKNASKKSDHMSTIQITPGCPFMARLEQYLSYYTVRYLQHRRELGISPDLKFVIDHSNNPGEGESKIIENIVQQAGNIRGRPCAVVTMDSDAVIQAIALGIPNMYVIRKDQPGNPALAVSIDRFLQALESYFPGESDKARLDFCALCLFRGNDYLRGLAVGLEKLWRAYVYTKLVDPVIQERGSLRFLIDTESKTFDLLFLKQLILNSYKNPSALSLAATLVQDRLQKQSQQQQTATSSPSTIAGSEAYRNRASGELEDDEDDQDDQDASNRSDDESSSADDSDSGSDEESSNSSALVEDESEDELDALTYSVKKFLTGVLWNLEMYCSGTCPDVSFTYEFQHSPPRRALVNFVDATAQIKQYARLLPSATRAVTGVAVTDKKYLHPLVCALILLPAEAGKKYLPQSIVAVHTQIVPQESKYLTQEEMEVIDEKVRVLIEILAASAKSHDIEIAKELSALYETRSPYIWTRLRVVNPQARPTVMPVSPNVVINQLSLDAASNSTTGTGTGGQDGSSTSTSSLLMFSDLVPQPDIKCTMVKIPPRVPLDRSSSISDSKSDLGVSFVLWPAVRYYSARTFAAPKLAILLRAEQTLQTADKQSIEFYSNSGSGNRDSNNRNRNNISNQTTKARCRYLTEIKYQQGVGQERVVLVKVIVKGKGKVKAEAGIRRAWQALKALRVKGG